MLNNSLAVQHASFEIFMSVLTGADTIDELKLIRDETIKIRSIRIKQMGLELPWIIRNKQSWSFAGYQR